MTIVVLVAFIWLQSAAAPQVMTVQMPDAQTCAEQLAQFNDLASRDARVHAYSAQCLTVTPNQRT